MKTTCTGSVLYGTKLFNNLVDGMRTELSFRTLDLGKLRKLVIKVKDEYF